MSNPLVKDARNNVWCVPHPSHQVIFTLVRMTPINGAMRTFDYAWETLALPNNTSSFHVFSIGKIDPDLIDLFAANSSWQTLSSACNATNVIIDLYNQTGIQLPRTRSWYRVTPNKGILIAIEKLANMAYSFDNDTISIRLYKNAYFELSNLPVGEQVLVGGGLMTSISDITALYAQIQALRNSPNYMGSLCTYINGFKQPTINIATVNVGDVAEFVYDTSIYKVADFQIQSLSAFSSTLDSKNKLLLHYAGSQDGYVDYVDQIDIYMIDATTQKGVYINKNAKDTLRMVTYKDYSIVSTYLSAYYPQFADANGYVNMANLYLRLHIRFAGKQNAPILESNCSIYLPKLSDSQIVTAMVGNSIGIPVWRAAALEASAYTKIMRSSYNEITVPLVESAYGYAHINTLMGQSLQPVQSVSNQKQVVVPPAFQFSAMAFEYDATGALLGYYQMGGTTLIYYPTNSSCVNVEFVEGVGANILDEVYDFQNVIVSSINNYRWYVKLLDQTTGLQKWNDVTGQAGYYTVSSGVGSWSATNYNNIISRMVRSDKNFLLYQTTLNSTDGLLMHSLNYKQNTLSGQLNASLQVPLGELDLWLNNKPLIPGVDYIFNFPTISIISKSCLVNAPGPQVLTVRFTGFCDDQLNMTPVNEVGFVWNGTVSSGNVYHLHNGKTQRIVVNGALRAASTVAFAQDTNTGSDTNGVPYCVRDYVNPLNGIIDADPYSLYYASRSVEKQVRNYLSSIIASTAVPLNPIPGKYKLYSPFIGKIIADLNSGILNDPGMVSQYPDSYVTQLCAPYNYLLANDPISATNLPNLTYCQIDPHWLSTSVSMSANNYRFIANVVRIYAGAAVSLSSLVVNTGL